MSFLFSCIFIVWVRVKNRVRVRVSLALREFFPTRRVRVRVRVRVSVRVTVSVRVSVRVGKNSRSASEF